MDIDTSQMRALAADLGKVGFSTVPKVAAIVKRTLNDTKADLQSEAAAGGASGSRLSSAISYDVTSTGLGGEIGPVTGGAGSLALLYYGNSKTGPVLKDPLFAMQRNAAKAEPYFLKVLGDVL